MPHLDAVEQRELSMEISETVAELVYIAHGRRTPGRMQQIKDGLLRLYYLWKEYKHGISSDHL